MGAQYFYLALPIFLKYDIPKQLFLCSQLFPHKQLVINFNCKEVANMAGKFILFTPPNLETCVPSFAFLLFFFTRTNCFLAFGFQSFLPSLSKTFSSLLCIGLFLSLRTWVLLTIILSLSPSSFSLYSFNMQESHNLSCPLINRKANFLLPLHLLTTTCQFTLPSKQGS